MSYETLIYDLSDGVAKITLSRPDERNGLNSQMRYDLVHAIKRAEAEARVVVLTGRGDCFCAGQDLTGDGRIASLDLERVLREEYMPLMQALQNCRLPVIAGVNGAASGSGAPLALSADIVVAKRSAEFTFTAARIGMFSEFGASYMLPRQVGFARAMGAVMLGEPISADQAEDWGMIWKSVADKQFDRVIDEMALKLAAGPTVAYRNIKRAMRSGLETGFDSQLEREAELQGKTIKSRDFMEGALAYSEQRMARFEGR